MKTCTLAIAIEPNEVVTLGRQYGFEFNSSTVALMESLHNSSAVVFVDTDGDGSPGYRVNVVYFDEVAGISQWVSRDTHQNFYEAVADMGNLATSTVSDFWGSVHAFERVI